MWDVCQSAVFEDWWGEFSEQVQDDVTAIVELLRTQPHARAAHPVPR
jgi:hypothetical protein